MLKPTVKRGLMLDFIPQNIQMKNEVNKNRVFKLNEKEISSGCINYVMSRELRVEDNFALLYAKELAEKLGQQFRVIIYLDPKLYSKRQVEFLKPEIEDLKENLKTNSIKFENVENNLESILKNSGAVIIDFCPVSGLKNTLKNLNCGCFEVDSHNIIPARFISDKQEFSAATLRRKVYSQIGGFLTSYPEIYATKKNTAYQKLKDFVENKLEYYETQRNDPNNDVVSALSPYLHAGIISSQRVVLEVLKSNCSRANKETFLEELIVRKELSDNFCLYSTCYDSFEGILPWAKSTLEAHKNDLRNYIYSCDEFENAKTHDELWNAIQKGLLKKGRIHGYLRMYWAKKILEWSKTPEEAIRIGIYLNDKYALDGNDPNGYVGVLWSIGGLHDRAFFDRPVFGKIRYMSESGLRKKFDVDKFINDSKTN